MISSSSGKKCTQRMESRFLRRVGSCLPDYIASHSRKYQSSYSPPREPQIPHGCNTLCNHDSVSRISFLLKSCIGSVSRLTLHYASLQHEQTVRLLASHDKPETFTTRAGLEPALPAYKEPNGGCDHTL
jgi:hypothetical protein